MTYLILFLEFFKMGALTFGGGYAMIPFIQETVASHGWLTTEELVDFIAVSESTPGAFAVNISTYVGSQVGGILGAMCATVGLVLPSFLLILLIAKGYEKFKDNRIVKGVMLGLKSTVVGLIAATVLTVGFSVMFPRGFALDAVGSYLASTNLWFILIVFGSMLFLLLRFKKFNPILVIVISAVLGVGAGYTGIITV